MTSLPAHPQRRRSTLFRFFVIAMIFLLSPIFVLGATVAATGVATVRVSEPGPDGLDLWIPVPALLMDVAVAAAPSLIPEHELDRARREIAPYLPMLRELTDAIEDLPSATLVQVDRRDEQVRIAKRGRNFEITVDGRDGKVRVSVPARLAGRALDLFG